jgi:hypothetical protein
MIKRIVSGGQTGADSAGLHAARSLGIETGGIAPKGWRICNPDGSDGSDPSLAEFGLTEHSSRDYPPRTIANVQNSDGTVWFGYEKSNGGKLTLSTAKRLGKPAIVNPSPEQLRKWVEENKIETLNVAGNRESDFNPTIASDTYLTIVSAFGGDRLMDKNPYKSQECQWTPEKQTTSAKPLRSLRDVMDSDSTPIYFD